MDPITLSVLSLGVGLTLGLVFGGAIGQRRSKLEDKIAKLYREINVYISNEIKLESERCISANKVDVARVETLQEKVNSARLRSVLCEILKLTGLWENYKQPPSAFLTDAEEAKLVADKVGQDLELVRQENAADDARYRLTPRQKEK